MTKIHKLSLLGGLFGLAVIASALRWTFMFYDQSQMIFGVSIGAIICIFSYIYNWMREIDESRETLEQETKLEREKTNKRLDAFTEWWTKQELE